MISLIQRDTLIYSGAYSVLTGPVTWRVSEQSICVDPGAAFQEVRRHVVEARAAAKPRAAADARPHSTHTKPILLTHMRARANN